MGHHPIEKFVDMQHFIEAQAKLADGPVERFLPNFDKSLIGVIVGETFPSDLVHEQWDGVLPKGQGSSRGRNFLIRLI